MPYELFRIPLLLLLFFFIFNTDYKGEAARRGWPRSVGTTPTSTGAIFRSLMAYSFVGKAAIYLQIYSKTSAAAGGYVL